MDIQFIPTEDLVSELCKRHEHSLFIGLKVLTGDKIVLEDGEIGIHKHWEGEHHTLVGLAMHVADSILKDLRNNSKNKDDF